MALKHLIACIVMIVAAIGSTLEIYREYVQDRHEYVTTDTLLEIGADVLIETDEFLYARDGKVICLTWDGTIVWESPFVSGNDMAFCGDGFFIEIYRRFPERWSVAFVTLEGEILWEKETGNIHSTALDASRTLLAAGTKKGVLWALSRDGAVLWTYENGEEIDEVAVAPDSSCVVFTDYTNYIKCVRNGELIWAKRRGEILKITNRIVTFSPDNSYIAYGSHKEYPRITVVTLDGENLWSYPLEDVLQSVVVTQDGQYIVAGCHGYVYKFSRTGALVWKSEVGADNERLSVTPGGEYIVVGSNDPYRLFVLNGEGAVLWKAKSRNLICAVGISPRGEYVVFSNLDTELLIFLNPPESSGF